MCTRGHRIKMAGESTQVENQTGQIRKGIWFNDLETFITDSKFWLHFDTAGQDAVETLRIKIYGQYVNLKKKDLDRIQQGATF